MNNSHERALVLGGGGSTGNAWLIGVIAGVRDAGLDVTEADLVVGTSAGATATAQVTSADIGSLYHQALTPVPDRLAALRPAGVPVVDHMRRTGDIIEAAHDPADMRARMGAAALELAEQSDPTDRWRATAAARLPREEWPRQDVLITAVDARTGDGVVFDRDSGVELVDAVAASTSSAAAYRIGDNRYIDGGYRVNAENADLASGYGRVLVLSPFGGRTRTPASWGLALADQVAVLREQGSRVEVIAPDGGSEHLFGPNGMDLSLRPAAARGGFDQGQALARELSAFWN